MLDSHQLFSQVNIQVQHSINIKSMPNHGREGKIQPSNREEISLSAEVIDLPNLQESGAESQSCKEGTEVMIFFIDILVAYCYTAASILYETSKIFGNDVLLCGPL
jgi:hypothetical protein